MRSIVLSSLQSTSFSSHGDIVGVETVPHLGLLLLASPSTLIFIQNGKITREIRWREMAAGEEEKVVVFGVIEGRAICIYSSGVVSSIDCESGEMEESIVSVAGEIKAGSINPVTCVISLVLSDYTITIIDPLLEIIVEGVDLTTSEKGMEELVTVGWGSEKTQFQGKAGKEEREKKAESRKKEEDSREIRVEWRRDGEMFLVNYYDEEKKERECTVWNGEGQLVSRILRESKMDEWSSFKPLGNMIAVAAEGGVIMAEKNGEKRNGVLRVNQVTERGRIKEGTWNEDASVLALQVEKTTQEGVLINYLQLWMCANFDWSCKMVLPFEGRIPAWRWNNERWNEIVIASPSRDVFTLNLSLTCHSSNGMVCTMGTSSLRLTDLTRLIIPPPMAQYSLPTPCPSILSFTNRRILLISHERVLYHYNVVIPSERGLSSSLVSSLPLSIPPNSIITALSLLEKGHLAVGFTHRSTHFLIHLDNEGKELTKREMDCAVISVKEEADLSVSLLFSDGHVENEMNGVESPSDDSPLVDFRLSETSLGFYTLHSSSCLFHSSSLISKGVSSFTYSSPFLAWIDNDFHLHVLDTITREKADVRCVEKGARLVSIAAPKVILQMPRGNLETIHARFFVERAIRRLLEEGKVKEALMEMRKHGVPFTLLKDFDHFFSSSTEWLRDMKDPNLLSLLITELRLNAEYSPLVDLLSSSLLALPSSHLILLFPSLLTSLLLTTPPRSTEAFRSIVDHLPHDSSRHSTLRNWLQVCTFFMNPSNIFKSSLSTYHLPFVVEVVEALSIDPNEYMSTLRELNELSDLSYRAYKMDVLREDWPSALLNLSNASPPRLSEVADIIKSKSLYALSLQIYGEDEGKSTHFNEIGRLALTEYCRGGRWREGAMVARLMDDADGEMKCREKMGDVRGWIGALEKREMDEEDKRAKKKEWKESLVKAAKWDTLVLLLEHLDERECGWEQRMEWMEKGKDWRGIEREVGGRKENLDAKMKKRREILKRRSDDIEMEIGEKCKEMERLSRRLNVVREKKKELMARMENGEMALEDLERCDAFSESSMASSRSSSSRSSRASSRASTMSRRTKKMEKKKTSLKEGGEWEDAAILIVLHSHWRTLRALLVESVDLVSSLISSRLFSSQFSLCLSLHSLESTLNRLAPVIWPARMLPHHLTGPLSAIYCEGVLSSEGGMPSSISMDPEMNPPPPLNESEKAWRLAL